MVRKRTLKGSGNKPVRPGKKVETVRHKDKRKNIPTEELRDFVREDEQQPRKMLYPRDPDLDPQLVWKGKDEQDAEPLEVPAVPVYIQEKIHPQAIIEDFKATAAKTPAEAQLDLFSDFNDLPEDFADRVDFYHHEGNWSNRLIVGDCLLVMTSLAEKENLKGRVQMIYIDPPYGIKFGSNWQVSTRKRDLRDGRAEDVTRQPEQIRAFRDTWEKGIHSYLAYLRDRLVVARDLLTESGSIFVQIGDENVHLIRCLMDEVFGSENFVCQVHFQKTGGASTKLLPTTVDYLIWYAKQIDAVKFRQLYLPRQAGDTSLDRYDMLLSHTGEGRRLSPSEIAIGTPPGDGKRFQLTSLLSDGESASPQDFAFRGVEYRPRAGSHWKTAVEGLRRLAIADRIDVMGSILRYRRLVDDFPVVPLTDRWESMQLGVELTYVVQTASSVVQRCLLMATDPGDLVLDPTCGSGTMAYVAEQWGRRWITIDTSRVAPTLARTRLMAARFPYYYLADDYPDTAQMADEEVKAHLRKTAPAATSTQDVRKGFVYRRVPHIMLKDVANNEEIDAVHNRWQQRLAPVLKDLNEQLKSVAGVGSAARARE